MTQEPAFLSTYGDLAKTVLAQGGVRDLDFSRRTYQVAVQAPKDREAFWVFMQFSKQGELADSFCSCKSYDDTHSCIHLAAAYLKVKQHNRLLNERFEESFWTCICRSYYQHYPKDKHVGIADDGYHWGSFHLQPKDRKLKKRLVELVDEREPPTEENSLKFSNLTPMEYEAWVEGMPNPSLNYELSIWRDLAQLLFLKQEAGEDYAIHFDVDKEGLPERIHVDFSDLHLSCGWDREDLLDLIPTLRSVRSPLQILDRSESQISMRYDPHLGEFHLTALKEDQRQPNGQLQIGDWRFIPGEGFYRNPDMALLETPIIDESKVGDFLDQYWDLVRSNLTEWTLHTDVKTLRYRIDITPEPSIRVQAYFNELGDLTKGCSRLFGSWAFVDGDGFYRVSGRRFPMASVLIPQPKISGFIAEHRSWLNHQGGFQVHLSTVEARLSYLVDEHDSLVFVSRLQIGNDVEGLIDLGEWVYQPGAGFFAKRAAGAGLSFQGGRRVPAHEIPMFVRSHRQELEQIQGFFSERSPVSDVGLRIGLDNDGHITIDPEIVLRPSYRARDVRFFEEFVYTDGEGFFVVRFDPRIPPRFQQSYVVMTEEMPLFLSYELDDLRSFALWVDPRLKKPSQLELKIDRVQEDPDAIGCFRTHIFYQSELGQTELAPLVHGCRQGQRYVVTDAGVLDLEEPRFDWVRQATGEGRMIEEGPTPFSTMELLRVHAFEDVTKAYCGEDDSVRGWLTRITELEHPELPSTKGLKSNLRSYQKVGLQWLWFLYKNGLSGLLCDDMGLGKTHQSMALLAAMRAELTRPVGRGYVPPPFLVVCPTSVLYHWQEKLNQFLPHLRVYTHYGVHRSIESIKKKRYDILLTSYGVLRVDRDVLRTFQFELAIFDEVQVAKNHQSRIHQSLLGIDVRMRLGLTGTPIENHLRELKSLFDVTLRGYMPSDKHYRDFFVTPIERDGDSERKRLLAAYIRPFILRRRKQDVLKDLPKKTEEVGHADLFPEQRELYDAVITESRARLFADLEDQSKPVPYVHIFAALTHLKQICNHPASYLKVPENYTQHLSGKWNLFKELLSEALASEQKVVVFTQYLAMLDIMKSYLDALEIGYAMIRGDTRDRQEQMKRFQKDDDCRVFLGSLQAVGLGVDLTAASVVIHYDRWWNPARENQATDRVHRIGQKRGVQVFKLVTVGTIEERIDAIIRRKGKLADEILACDDENLVKALTREELMELLQYVTKEEPED